MRRETDRHLLERLTWDEVARRLENGAAAVLPIGAAAKEHGFHLPMNTDRVQAEWLAAEALLRQVHAPAAISGDGYDAGDIRRAAARCRAGGRP